ncbi:MAG: helix-turn-helix domain-containing protein [candidate division WOR-3 bacterium]|nr:MAG: helix-turn-helix domain-containing protein [candidate division WOR-3 bacterium]
MESRASDPGSALCLGRRLRELREAAGLSQKQVAVRIPRKAKGMFRVISRLERGRMPRPGIG